MKNHICNFFFNPYIPFPCRDEIPFSCCPHSISHHIAYPHQSPSTDGLMSIRTWTGPLADLYV